MNKLGNWLIGIARWCTDCRYSMYSHTSRIPSNLLSLQVLNSAVLLHAFCIKNAIEHIISRLKKLLKFL